MEQFEIYFDDLCLAAKERYMKANGVESPEDLNHEYSPIAIIDIEKEEKEV